MDTVQVNSSELHNSERADAEKHQEHLISVLVNGLPVNLLGRSETGKQVKTAAIEQGVPINLDFVLVEDLPDGGHREVADHENVHIHEGLRFTAHARENIITICVNEQPVKLEGHRATGAEIKAAAIAQGVHIQLNFVLQEELPNGTSRIVGDNDEVHLREHLRFTAIAPDDNS